MYEKYPFEWTRRQRSVVSEVEREQKTFSRDFVGARSILDLDNYVERKKRERERGKRQWQRGSGKWQTDTTITTTHPGISSLRITSRRNTGKEVLRGNLLERGWICLSFHMKRVQRERKHQMIFLFWRVVNPLWPVIVIHILRFTMGLSRRNLEGKCLLSFR